MTGEDRTETAVDVVGDETTELERDDVALADAGTSKVPCVTPM